MSGTALADEWPFVPGDYWATIAGYQASGYVAQYRDVLVEELGVTIPAVFQSDEYNTRAEAMDQDTTVINCTDCE
mgnify:CR=1 FL=1